jgi:hypothetical protein
VASHHHAAAIRPKDNKRSASGVRREIGSILSGGDRRLTGRWPSAKGGNGGLPALSVGGLYQTAIKLWVCWTKSKISVMGFH